MKQIAPWLVAVIGLAGPLHADVSSDFRLHSGNLTGSGVDRLNSFAIDDRIYSGNRDYLNALLDAGYPVPSVVLHAVSRGMTVSDAAYFMTRANSDLAAEIYLSVSQLLPYMPSWACGRSLSPRFERRQTYENADLGPDSSIRSVAERYFNDYQRLTRTDATGGWDDPDWTRGEYHLRASIDELIEVTDEGLDRGSQDWWYQPGSGVGRSGTVQPPVFVSLYPNGKQIVTDTARSRLEELKAAGTTDLPVVFIFNPPEYMPISRIASAPGPSATTGSDTAPAPGVRDDENSVRKVANAFFLFGNRVTPPREWHLADYHIAATAEELQEVTPLPDVDLLPASLRQKIISELQGGFEQPVQITLFGDSGDLWLDDPARVAVAISQGFLRIPVVFHYHESSRFGCNLPATCLPAVKDAISEAGGNVKPRPGPGGGQPPAILPPVYPPVILPPGLTPDRPLPVSPE